MAKAKRSKKQQKKFNLFVQLVEYMISGGVYFWAGYAAFFAFDKGLHWSLWWAKITASIVGWIVNYLMQRFWVFRGPHLRQHRTEVTARYAVITLIDFLLDYVIVWALKQVGITPYIGQFASAGFFTVWNYVWYRFWVFTNRWARRKK